MRNATEFFIFPIKKPQKVDLIAYLRKSIIVCYRAKEYTHKTRQHAYSWAKVFSFREAKALIHHQSFTLRLHSGLCPRPPYGLALNVLAMDVCPNNFDKLTSASCSAVCNTTFPSILLPIEVNGNHFRKRYQA